MLNEFNEVVELSDDTNIQDLFGNNNKNIELLEELLQVKIITRGESLSITGEEEPVQHTTAVLNELILTVKRGIHIDGRDIAQAVKMQRNGTLIYFHTLFEEEITKNAKGMPIRPKTFGQRTYIQMIKKHDIVFGVGPAGTGKTYLAVVMAVYAWKKGNVSKIILTRPAVEAGESLGFLPGDLKEKVDPYLRPVYDALYDIFGTEHTTRLMDRGVIEIAPLAYMRGRTLDHAFVILDEAQNTTIAQMKMFLTRLGYDSKMIVNGDMTQIDLPKGATSGLVNAEQVLKDVKDIGFVYFEHHDVVRHPLVAEIIKAYEGKQN
ncbi:PhoH family protein [Listeria monocytogenes]|uniref:PhoH family protein n=1 Tax=Listeria monocytogenes TaxID=1639 RepID=UPI0010D5B899|nr:PhoH family protein [Listeria monocytogenes]EAD2139122.1 PhoH family protein [Listeria monocytogenes]MBO9052732.1 PhoH family protein [Listeria monocytogenes]